MSHVNLHLKFCPDSIIFFAPTLHQMGEKKEHVDVPEIQPNVGGFGLEQDTFCSDIG